MRTESETWTPALFSYFFILLHFKCNFSFVFVCFVSLCWISTLWISVLIFFSSQPQSLHWVESDKPKSKWWTTTTTKKHTKNDGVKTTNEHSAYDSDMLRGQTRTSCWHLIVTMIIYSLSSILLNMRAYFIRSPWQLVCGL